MVQTLEWKQTDGRTDGDDCITSHANSVGKNRKHRQAAAKPATCANSLSERALVPIPFTDPGQISQKSVDPQSTLLCQICLDRFILSPSRLVAINPKFLWTSAFCDVAFWRWSQKVKRICTTKSFPPIQPYLNCFYSPTASWRNRAHKLCRSKAWRTHKHTNKNLNVFGRSGGG